MKLKPGKKAVPLIWMMPVLIAASIGTGAPAYGFAIDTGNPDIAIRWDNSLRYNLGWRAQKQDSRIVNTQGFANSNLKFDRGDIITNRLDLLSEFDFVYKDKMGFRVSAQAWYDNAYTDKEELNPEDPFPAYPGARYNSYTKRWNMGPSGEFLDAFVFGRFSLGDVNTNVRLGQHNIYWGESLFSFIHGVSYSQGPVDIRKASATPGTEAKELYKPLNQFSFTTQIAPTFSIAGQYFFDWKPTVFPDGGTYWGASDAFNGRGGTTLPGGYPFVGVNNEPDDKRGDWGLMARWRPELIGGTLGFYYREYTDKFPLYANGRDGVGGFTGLGMDYADHRSKLIGMSLAKSMRGVSVGAEISYREKTNLLSMDSLTIGNEPLGNTWHGLINLMGSTGTTALFDSSAWSAELTYSRLDKVTDNHDQFRSSSNCRAAGMGTLSCANKDNLGISISYTPTWTQVMDGVDLSMPLFYTRGLEGTSPVTAGGFEGNGSYSVGLTADYLNQYSATLAYNGFFTKKKYGPDRTVADAAGGYTWDRGNVTLTVKATF